MKTQFIISMVIFSLVLIAIGVSAILAEQQVAELNNQQDVAGSIQSLASELNHISNDYMLYQENVQLSLWHSAFFSLSENLTALNPTSPELKTIASNVKDGAQQLDVIFSDAVSFLESAPRNQSVRVLPEFQTAWDRLVAQNQALSSDAALLSQALRNQAVQLRLESNLLILLLLGVFAAYFLTMYLLVYHRALKSVSNLQTGIKIIGSGNLEHVIETDQEDEIAELSSSFNQMTANLKKVTASKTELEMEMAERKKAEEELRESEKSLSRSQEIAHLGSWELDLATNRLSWSDEVYRIFGLKPQEFEATYEAFLVAVHPDDRAAVDAAYSSSLVEGRDTYEIEHRVVRKSTGEIRTVQEKCNHIRDGFGRVIRSVGMVHDITERKRAEEARIESEMNYRRLFETSQDGIIARDLRGDMIDCNQAYERMIGYSKEELKNLSVKQLLPKKWHEQREEVNKEVLETGDSIVYEREYLRKDGLVFPASLRTWPLTNEKGETIGVWSIVRDITEQKNLQRKLEQQTENLEKLVEERTKQLKDAERLAAIGQTAGMVGHDIRNPLQAILGDLYLVKDDLASVKDSEEKGRMQESLESVEKSILYINKIVADLQDFAKPLNPCVEKTDLRPIIDEILQKNTLPENIKCQVSVNSKAREVMVDPAFMKRILGNLIFNAVQAMPDGGELKIRSYREDGEAVITVEDTGTGISEEVRSKLFTPLFTTKSKGQGFGLAVVKRLTEAMCGTVTFESTQGKGTTFTIRLPPPKR
ncbi:MAG TPA: PAS domain S-box protein [Candidatus Bathyarchaeia archaeon]